MLKNKFHSMFSWVLVFTLVSGLFSAIVPSHVAIAAPEPESGFKAISVGGNHSAVIKADGSLWTWGNNSYGQLGIGSTSPRHTPIQVGTATNWVSVSAGSNHTAAIKADGSLWTWGSSSYYQLGIGSTSSEYMPKQVGTDGDSDWASVSAGDINTYAIKMDGSLWAWGSNLEGQLGDGYSSHDSFGTSSRRPKQVGTDRDWASVSAGTYYYVTAIKTNGSLWTWGHNLYGQLGTPTSRWHQNSPKQVGTGFTSVSAGYQHTVSLKAGGSLWTWGRNNYGELGNGATGGSMGPSNAAPVSVGTGFISVSAGNSRTMGVKADGSLWAWGISNSGVAKSVPERIGSDADWVSVAAGGGRALITKADGSLWAWGSGILGDGAATGSSTPVKIFSSNNDDSPRPASLRVKVMNRNTMEIIPGAVVKGGGTSAVTDAAGRAGISLSTHDSSTFAFEASGYFNLEIVLSPSDSEYSIYLTPAGGSIYIEKVIVTLKDGMRRDALNGEAVTFDTSDEKSYSVSCNVNWNGKTPGSVKLRGTASGKSFPFTNGRASIAFGQEFPVNEGFEVVAKTQDGAITETQGLNINIQEFAADLELYLPNIQGDALPGGIPLIGGKPFKFGVEGINICDFSSNVRYEDSKVIVEFLPKTNNQSAYVQSGIKKLTVKMVEDNGVEADIHGKIEIPISDIQNGKWAGYISLGLSQKGSDLIEIWEPKMNLSVLGVPVLLKLTLSAGITADFGIKGGDFEGSITPKAGGRFFGGPGVGFDLVEVSVGVYGQLVLDFNVGLKPKNFYTEGTASAGVVATAKLWQWENQAELQLGEWKFPDNGRSMLASEGLSDSDASWQLIGREYLNENSGFTGDNLPLSRNMGAPDPTNTENTNIYENIFPTAQSGLQIIDGVPVMVYTVDDDTRNPQDGLKLVYSVYRDSSWSELQAVNDTGTMDSGFHFSGSSLVWEKTKTNLPEEIGNFTEIMQESEIYYASFDGEGWSEPTVLTDNSVADFAPVVVENDSWRLVAWLTNSVSDIFSQSGQTDICYRIYNGTSWGEIQTIPDVGAVGRITAGFNGTNGIIVYQKEGSLYRIATNKPTEVVPMGETRQYALGYYNGTCTLANFDENGRLTITRNLLNSYPQLEVIETGADLLTAPMIAQNGKNLYICWVERKGDTDALCGVSFIDDAWSSWSECMVLVSEERNVKRPHITLANNGTLMASYLLEEPIKVFEENGEFVYSGGKCNLYSTMISPEVDLAIEAGSLFYDDRIYATTGAVSLVFTVENVGQKRINGYMIEVYEDGILTETIDRSYFTLNAGENAEMNCSYRPETAGVTKTLSVKVCPYDNAIVDADLTNNTAEISIGAVNAVVTEAYFTKIHNTYWLNTSVQNQGSVTADKFIVKIRKNSVDGAVVFTKTYENILANERFSFSEKMTNMTWKDGTAIYFVTVETSGDNDSGDSMLAVATDVVTQVPTTAYYFVFVKGGTTNLSTATKGATVTIKAGTPPAGKVFDKWTSSDGVSFANANAESTTFTMPSKDVTVTANYKNKLTQPAQPSVKRITVSPKTANVQKGKSKQFSANVTVANGATKTVTWAVSGNKNKNTKISKSGKLTIAANETAKKLTVTVSSTLDKSKTDKATVTVTSPLKIKTQPKGGIVRLNKAITLKVTATGGMGKLKYQWYGSKKQKSGFKKISGAAAKKASYKAPTKTKGTRYYYCIVTDTNKKNVKTRVVKVTVK